jgi:prevent-host-death family protein
MSRPARIPVRELRNRVSDVLRRVEAGETFEVTVNDRPVAVLMPRAVRPVTMPTREFMADLVLADADLRDDLAAQLTEGTDDLADPWTR